MTGERVSENSLRPIKCRPKQFIPLLWEPAALKEVGQVGDQTALLGDEEEAIQDVRGGHGYGYRSSLTFLDNVLTVGESAGGELASLTLTQEAT